MYVCVLAKGPNLVFGSKNWLSVRVCVCAHMDVYVWPLQWSFDSRRMEGAGCSVAQCAFQPEQHNITQHDYDEENRISS